MSLCPVLFSFCQKEANRAFLFLLFLQIQGERMSGGTMFSTLLVNVVIFETKNLLNSMESFFLIF